MMILLCGLPGTGKTTLAKALAPKINAKILSSDEIRKKIFQRPTYETWERKLVYDVMFLIAKYLLNSNISCILDATFSKESTRKQIIKMLSIHPSELIIILCSCPEDIALSRLEHRRNDYSDANSTIYHKMKKNFDEIKMKHTTINTLKDLNYNIEYLTKIILKNEK